MIKENSEEVKNFEYENYKAASEIILEDIKNGFTIVAEKSDTGLVGFMMFSYEWSDWRNGNFFFLQSIHVKKDLRNHGVFSQMQTFLDQYMKETGSCGIRVYYENRLREVWNPLMKKLNLGESHYYIYHTDTAN